MANASNLQKDVTAYNSPFSLRVKYFWRITFSIWLLQHTRFCVYLYFLWSLYHFRSAFRVSSLHCFCRPRLLLVTNLQLKSSSDVFLLFSVAHVPVPVKTLSIHDSFNICLLSNVLIDLVVFQTDSKTVSHHSSIITRAYSPCSLAVLWWAKPHYVSYG